MTLTGLKNILLELTPYSFHYKANAKPDRYIVWAEDSEGSSVYIDNRKQLQSIQGTIDYFTRTDNDPMVAALQNKLSVNEIPWKLSSVQYEEETGYIHYEWVWEVDALG